ncbi:hypothetical protein [Quadrisphaera sp. INWT6]|uniref:hypothetical protein n=1 Tax=Quadrisphaera sp. INWT6 TaxID=2596917 RepID=UPI001892241A|nr:hypothetical protein [Quadrisphaera sp. INWT6]MBF5082579.1 hypothetical protein [Quadrisphaera sp. INWT6]
MEVLLQPEDLVLEAGELLALLRQPPLQDVDPLRGARTGDAVAALRTVSDPRGVMHALTVTVIT